MYRVLLTALSCLALGGCIQTTSMAIDATSVASTGSFAYGSNEQPIDASMTQYMPWQLGPSSPKTKAAHDEPIVTASIPSWGPVKGRADVLARFPAPLEAVPGRNRTVRVCERQAREAATRYNPNVQVEAVSTRPERRLGPGRYEGQMRIRIIYARAEFHEVREAVMDCTTTRRGRFVRANVVWPT